jgi:enoyl-CoA hydratase/carnithine racemase
MLKKIGGNMTQEILLVNEADGVATLTLNRPQVMNAFNLQMLRALKACVDDMRRRVDMRVLIITGAGEKAFSAGADLKERRDMDEAQVRDYLFTLRRLYAQIEHLNKPVIAAVNGLALGGGTELALACDIRLVAAGASFGLPETRLAIIPGGGGTQRLPRLVGRGKAKELIFTGRRIPADEALAIGLANRVCAPEALLGACRQMADQICQAAPIAIEQAKFAINRGLEVDLDSGLAIEANAYAITIPTEDRREGLAAFREKRKPVYRGQ